MRSARATLGLLALALVPATARAQAPVRDAAAFFEEGASAYARGDFRAAALAFEEANRRVHSGSTLYNAAVAWEQAGSIAQASDDFDAALADPTLDQEHVRDARAHLAALERRVGRLDVSADESVVISIAHVARVPAPLQVHLLPGTYSLRGDFASGRSVTRTVSIEAQKVTLIDMPREERPASLSSPLSAVPAPVPATETRPRSSVTRTLGWIALGGAGVGAASAAGFGLVALGAKRDFDRSGATDPDAHDRAAGFRTAANVAWVTTAVFLVSGAVLLLAAPRGER
jgi:hypothetical protein